MLWEWVNKEALELQVNSKAELEEQLVKVWLVKEVDLKFRKLSNLLHTILNKEIPQVWEEAIQALIFRICLHQEEDKLHELFHQLTLQLKQYLKVNQEPLTQLVKQEIFMVLKLVSSFMALRQVRQQVYNLALFLAPQSRLTNIQVHQHQE